ncbi:hypothetical protein X975_10141, partial [Stegodyphus mimosarum]
MSLSAHIFLIIHSTSWHNVFVIAITLTFTGKYSKHWVFSSLCSSFSHIPSKNFRKVSPNSSPAMILTLLKLTKIANTKAFIGNLKYFVFYALEKS